MKTILLITLGFALGALQACGDAKGSGGSHAVEIPGPNGVRCFAIIGDDGGVKGGELQMNTTKVIKAKELRLSIIDGVGPEPVIMVKGPIDGVGCKDDRHCAAHTSGPTYPCCKCGAEFKPKVV